MADGLDDLFTPEELAEAQAWSDDAYTIGVEVPASKVTEDQLDELYAAIGDVVDRWSRTLADRDWDPFIYGHGPAFWIGTDG